MNKILLFFIFMFGGTLLYSQNIVIDGVIFSADGKTLIKYPEDKVEKEYVVPEGVEVIGKNSFMYTKYLNILTLPLYLKEIDEWAFGYSSIQTINWYTFPEKIVGEYIFGYDNSKIVTFNVLDNNNSNCISIDGVLFSKNQKALLCFPPKKVNDRLSGRYEVPEGVEIIAKNAFSGAELAEIALPSSLVRIEDCAFFVSWFSITGLSTTIRTLNKIDCNAIIPPTIIGNPFMAPGKIRLSVPEKCFDIYRNAPYWQDFYSINGDTGIMKNQAGASTLKVWIQDDILYLESDKEVTTVGVYDANGVCIWNEYINNRTWELITSKLSKGLLLVKATTVDGNQETFKLSN